MYIKVINPKTHGHNAYANTGSAAQVTNYLRQEALKEGEEARFFTREQTDVTGAEVTQLLDNNVKGLRQQDAKFYSLVISPSAEELALIGNDGQKLEDYTRRVMEVYAAEFKLKDGRQLGPEEVVWAAVRHDTRAYRGDDVEVKAGEAQVGELKPGLQAHIHVVVSGRDAAQKITLNPMGRADRFDRVGFAARSGAEFTAQVRLYNPAAYQAGPVPSVEALTATLRQAIRKREPMEPAEQQRRDSKIGERVEKLNQLLPVDARLEAELVTRIARERQYDRTFYASLKRLEVRATEQRPVEHPYTLLKTGRTTPEPQTARLATEVARSTQQAGRAMAQLMTPPQGNQTQDMSEKKDRSWEREW